MSTGVSNNSSAFFPAPFMDEATFAIYLEIKDIQTKILPVICGLGFATNVLSLLVFLQPSLRRLSCSVYLAAKAVSDFVFLLTVFVVWLSRIDIKAFHMVGICQLVIFFSYLSAFISIWLAVALTVENLLCVVRPWFVQRSCNAYSATILTVIIVVLGIVFYQFSLWNNGVRSTSGGSDSQTNSASPRQVSYIVNTTRNGTSNTQDSTHAGYEFSTQINTIEKDMDSEVTTQTLIHQEEEGGESIQRCVSLEEFNNYVVAMTYIDSLITLFVPLIILAFTNTAIVVLAVRARRRHRRLYNQKRQYQLPGTHLAPKRHNASYLETQASRFLFSVSMTLLLFHMPSHTIRLKMLVALASNTPEDYILQRIFETLYYTHYAIGFFVYLCFGSNFRRVFLTLLFKFVPRR